MTLKAGLGRSVAASVEAAVGEAVAAARAQLGTDAGLALVASTVDYDSSELTAELRRLLPGVPVHGSTSSLGLLTLDGVTSGPDGAVAVLLLAGARFAASQATYGGDATEAGARVAQQVLDRLGGERPGVLLVAATPGEEEAVLVGIGRVLPGVPVFGGSAADHLIAGDWSVLTTDGALREGVSLAGVAGASWGGALVVPYSPTGLEGVVDRSEGRLVHSLAGRPPGETLNAWLGGALDLQVESGGNVLAQTALRPLGVRHALGDGREHFLTVHPARLLEEGPLAVFAQLAPGTVVCSMQGTEDGLLSALDELLDRALAAGKLAAADVRAGLLIYCAGCSAVVGERLSDALPRHLGSRLPDARLLGLCTFGEQGNVPSLGNVHQNLALSLVLFGESTAAPS